MSLSPEMEALQALQRSTSHASTTSSYSDVSDKIGVARPEAIPVDKQLYYYSPEDGPPAAEEDDVQSQATSDSEETVGAGDVTTVLKSGYLDKRSSKRKAWKRRWFVLTPTRLAYYKNDKEYELLHILPLSLLVAIHEVLPSKRQRTTHRANSPHALALLTRQKSKNLVIGCDSIESMIAWRDAISEAANRLGALSEEAHDAEAQLRDLSLYASPNHSDVTTPQRSDSHPASPERALSPGTLQDAVLAAALSHSSQHNLFSPANLRPSSPLSASEEDEEEEAWEKQMAARQKITELQRDHLMSPTFSDEAIKSGYLHKMSGHKGYKYWRKRWFVLRSDRLSYYASADEYTLHKSIPLNEMLDVSVVRSTVSQSSFSSTDEPVVAKEKVGQRATSPPTNAQTTDAKPGDALIQTLPAELIQQTSWSADNKMEKGLKGKYPMGIVIRTPQRKYVLAADLERETIAWAVEIEKHWRLQTPPDLATLSST